MTNYIINSVFFCLLAIGLNAQIAIGKPSVNGANTLLDFAGNTVTNAPTDQETTNHKGIVIPAVESSPVFPVVSPTTINPNNGTFLFDRSTNKIRMFENGVWKDMTDEGSGSSLIVNNSPEVGNGVILGAATTTAQGVLVLESNNKAIILPHIKNPHLTVRSPYPGMMCYDTVSNSLAIFDGLEWSFWK